MKPSLRFVADLISAAIVVVATVSTLNGRAADVVGYGTVKIQWFEQTNAVPAPQGFYFNAFVDTDPAFGPFAACGPLVTNATVQLADGSTLELFPDGVSWNWNDFFDDQASLDAAYPNGTNKMNIYAVRDGAKTNLSLIVSGNTYPVTTPRISNLLAAQSVVASTNFILTWDAWVGGTVSDFIQLQLYDDFNNTVFETARYGYPGALAGTNTSVLIPSNTLASGRIYTGFLLFGRGVSNTTAYIGAVGVGAYGKETLFPLQTAGSPDTIPPSLWESHPSYGETAVPRNCPVSFTFSEPMLRNYSIAWSTNVDPCNFIYTWSPDRRSFIGIYKTNWPANAVITWTLGPSDGFGGFMDLAGNPLSFQPQSGSFTTGTNLIAHDASFYAVYKEAMYLQTNASPPALDTNAPYRFGALVDMPCPFTVTNATLRLPNGTTTSLELDDDGSQWRYRRDFASQVAMDAAYPSGSHVLTMHTIHEGVRVVTNLLTGDVYPGSTPRISNFSAAQAVDPSKNFTLTWDVFTGGTVTDFVNVWVEGDTAGWFETPQPGAPGALNGTNTSAQIPAGTLAASETHEAGLLFVKFTVVNTNSYPGVLGISGYARETEFSLVTTQPAVTLSEPMRISVSQFQFRLTGAAGQNYTIQYSTTLTNWNTLYVTNAPAHSFIVIDSAAPAGRRYYRAKVGL